MKNCVLGTVAQFDIVEINIVPGTSPYGDYTKLGPKLCKCA